LASDDLHPSEASITPASGYTLELRLTGQRVVIIGGGRTAMRKLPNLLAAGARVDLIDPAPLTEIPPHPQLRHHRRGYQPADLSTARLVFAATNNPQLNAQIAKDATALGTLCCRIDSAENSDFITPARLNRPPLTFSVSTGGESPAMASALRDLLAKMIPGVWQTATELSAAIRRKVLTEQPQIPYNQQVLLLLIEQGLLESLERADEAGTDRLLLKHFGADFTLKNLRFTLPEGTP